MLDEKLRNAKRQSAQNRLYVLILIMGLVALGGAAVLFMETSRSPAEKETERPSIPKVAEDPELYREHALAILEQLENSELPKLSGLNLEGWAPERARALGQLQTQAQESFTQGDFKRSHDLSKQAIEDVFKLVSEHQQGFENSLGKAQTAYHTEDETAAALEILKALSFKPNDVAALVLEEKIQKLPQIKTALEQARIAKLENNLEKELAALRDVLDLDPDFPNIAERVERVFGQIQEQAYVKAIQDGNEALERLDVETARSALEQAERLFPGRGDVNDLKVRVLAMESNIRLEQALRRAMDAVRNDDWAEAQKYFMTAEREAPKRREVVDGLTLSKTILDLQNRLQRHHEAPLRLGVAANRNAAKSDIEQAETFFSQSPRLEKAAQQVVDILDQMAAKRPVQILSDGMTFIQVRAVGRVGEVNEKTIFLAPGTYLFEGQRQGYKSVLLEVDVPLDGNPEPVRVICDEPI